MDYTLHLFTDLTGLWSREKITPGYKTTININGASEATISLDNGDSKGNYKASGGIVTLPLSAWAGESITVSATAKRGNRTVTWHCGTLRRNPSGEYEVERVSAYDVLLRLRLECEELRRLISARESEIKKLQEATRASYIVERGKS